MNKSDTLNSYMAEIVDIMQEVQQKMQRVKEIKADMDKLKKADIKPKVTTTTNKMTSASHGASLCKDAGASLRMTCECGCKINKSS